jgi:hypothetical protein
MAGVVAAAVVGSALIGSQASKSAARTQAGAAADATAAQERMFERQVELQKPFREAGMAGQNRLLELLGIQSFGPSSPWNEEAYLKQNPDVAAAIAKGEIGTGKEHYEMFGRDEGRNLGFTPAKSADFGKYASAEFTPAQFQADPGYAFRVSEGMKALDRTAAARGGLISGAALRGATRYGQEMGSQEYQNAFNRYQTSRTNTLNPFASLAGVAQSSANTLGTAAGQLGGQIGSNIIGAGNAMAAGQVGSANAIAQGVGQGINFYQGQQYLNRLPNFNQPNYSGYTTSPSTWDAAALNAGPQPY